MAEAYDLMEDTAEADELPPEQGGLEDVRPDGEKAFWSLENLEKVENLAIHLDETELAMRSAFCGEMEPWLTSITRRADARRSDPSCTLSPEAGLLVSWRSMFEA